MAGYRLDGEVVTNGISISPLEKVRVSYHTKQTQQSGASQNCIDISHVTLRSCWSHLSQGPYSFAPHELLTLCGLRQPAPGQLFQTQVSTVPQCVAWSGFHGGPGRTMSRKRGNSSRQRWVKGKEREKSTLSQCPSVPLKKMSWDSVAQTVPENEVTRLNNYWCFVSSSGQPRNEPLCFIFLLPCLPPLLPPSHFLGFLWPIKC